VQNIKKEDKTHTQYEASESKYKTAEHSYRKEDRAMRSIYGCT